jgi:hypothetical protein
VAQAILIALKAVAGVVKAETLSITDSTPPACGVLLNAYPPYSSSHGILWRHD